MISALSGRLTLHSFLPGVVHDNSVSCKAGGTGASLRIRPSRATSINRHRLQIRSVTETNASLTKEKDTVDGNGGGFSSGDASFDSRDARIEDAQSTFKKAAEPAPTTKAPESAPPVIPFVDQLADRLIGDNPNGKLVRALAEAAWAEFQTSAEEAQNIWLNLPPKELTDTLPPALLADPGSRFIRVNGVTVHYKERWYAGNSGAQSEGATSHAVPTLVLLHGFAGSVFSWRLVLDSLTEALPGGCRVIAFDRPPFGLTSRPLEVAEGNNPYTNEGAAQLTLGLMDALGVQHAVLVGHSAGASIAVEAALQAPERIPALILAAPSVFVRGEFLRKADLQTQLRLLYYRTILQVPGAGLNYVRYQYLKRREAVLRGDTFGYYDDALITEEVKQGYVQPMRAQDWDRGALQLYRSLAFTPVGDRIQGLRAPVCIIQGRQDRAVTEATAQQLRGQLAEVTSVEYHVVEKCGHLPQEEHVEKFTSLVSNFLRKLYPADDPAAPPPRGA